MSQIVVCDDNPVHASKTIRIIREATQEDQNVALAVFSSAEALLAALESGQTAADVAVLDVCLDQSMDGISLAKRINALDPCCQIVFQSGYLEYAQDVYDAEHVSFVLKSAAEERLWPAIARAIERNRSMRQKVIPVRTRDKTILLRADEVLYIERQARQTLLVTQADTYVTRDKPDALLAGPIGASFLRCHQSFYVNPAFITAVDRVVFSLSNGASVPISRSFRPAAQQALFAYLSTDLKKRKVF